MQVRCCCCDNILASDIDIHHREGVGGSVAMGTANCHRSIDDVVISDQILSDQGLGGSRVNKDVRTRHPPC